MLATLIGILTGKAKIKVTALICAVILLMLNWYRYLQIPQSEAGDWFQYGLFVGVLALSISLLIDVVVLQLEHLRIHRSEQAERLQKRIQLRAEIIGNFKALRKDVRYKILQILFGSNGGATVQMATLHGTKPTAYASLIEQKILVKIGGTSQEPRVKVHSYVVEVIEGEEDRYRREWEVMRKTKSRVTALE